MGLRPVEIDAGSFEAQAAQPVRLGGEQLVEPLRSLALSIAAAHNARARQLPPRLDLSWLRRKQAGDGLARSRRIRPTAAPDKTARKRAPARSLRFMLGVALLAWALRSFIVQPFNIPSGSMLPTLYIGDYLVGREMAVRLFALQLPVRLSADSAAASWATCRSAATSSSFAIPTKTPISSSG